MTLERLDEYIAGRQVRLANHLTGVAASPIPPLLLNTK